MDIIHLHPAVVHFPIALWVIATGFDVGCLMLPRYTWLDRTAVSLYALATLGAGLAVVTGKMAESGIGPILPHEERLVAQHGESAFLTLAAFFLVSLARFESAWRDRRSGRLQLNRFRVFTFLAALLALGLLYRTAERGVVLVHRHGIGVESRGRSGSG